MRATAHPAWTLARSLLLGIVLIGVVYGGLALRSAVGADAAADAMKVCQSAMPQASEHGYVDRILRAESSTASEVVTWQEGRFGDVVAVTSPFRGTSPNARLTVCLYHGEFITPGGPPLPDGSVRPPRDVLRLIVADDGTATFDSAGYLNHMAPDVPSELVPSG